MSSTGLEDILGLIDSLEATILEGKKVPLTDKIMLDEKEILTLIDKVRNTLKNKGKNIRDQVEISRSESKVIHSEDEVKVEKSGSETIEKANKKAKEMIQGANEYSDYILANLQLVINKMQKDIIKLERNLENGRQLLDTEIKEHSINQRSKDQ